jgi:hypothetical protein
VSFLRNTPDEQEARARQRAGDLSAKAERDAQRQAALDATFRTEVMAYASEFEYQRDGEWRHANGWRIEGQSLEQSRAKVGHKALGAGGTVAATTLATGGCAPLGCLAGCGSLLIPWRTKPKITVTWVKDPVVPVSNVPNQRPHATPPSPTIASQIAELAQLHDGGVLTDEEFQTKKADLLSRM